MIVSMFTNHLYDQHNFLHEFRERINTVYVTADRNTDHQVNQRAYKLLSTMKNLCQVHKPGVSIIEEFCSSLCLYLQFLKYNLYELNYTIDVLFKR